MRNSWIDEAVKPLSKPFEKMAIERQNSLTKPQGSLGRLEELAIQLSALQENINPSVKKPWISIFAGDHGITQEGISAFPQAVTTQMIKNFLNGGAAISVLASHMGAHLEVINTGTIEPLENQECLINSPVRSSTHNFLHEPAMGNDELDESLLLGKNAVQRALKNDANIFIAGEMGIGNTTSATALCCVLFSVAPEEITGAGTGLNLDQIQHKISIINQSLTKHSEITPNQPMELLRTFGGFEIAAMVGAFIHCGQQGMPCVVDGFISTAAAAVAIAVHPNLKTWLIFSHQSAEKGHKLILEHLSANPILQLDMRLGEGSGAAIALSIIKDACELHNKMATFTEAAVSSKNG